MTTLSLRCSTGHTHHRELGDAASIAQRDGSGLLEARWESFRPGPEPDLPARPHPGGCEGECPWRGRDGAHEHDVKGPVLPPRRVLRRPPPYLALERESPHDVAKEMDPPLADLHQDHPEVGASDGDRDAGEAGSAPQVQDPGSTREPGDSGERVPNVRRELVGPADQIDPGSKATKLRQEASQEGLSRLVESEAQIGRILIRL